MRISSKLIMKECFARPLPEFATTNSSSIASTSMHMNAGGRGCAARRCSAPFSGLAGLSRRVQRLHMQNSTSHPATACLGSGLRTQTESKEKGCYIQQAYVRTTSLAHTTWILLELTNHAFQWTDAVGRSVMAESTFCSFAPIAQNCK